MNSLITVLQAIEDEVNTANDELLATTKQSQTEKLSLSIANSSKELQKNLSIIDEHITTSREEIKKIYRKAILPNNVEPRLSGTDQTPHNAFLEAVNRAKQAYDAIKDSLQIQEKVQEALEEEKRRGGGIWGRIVRTVLPIIGVAIALIVMGMNSEAKRISPFNFSEVILLSIGSGLLINLFGVGIAKRAKTPLIFRVIIPIVIGILPWGILLSPFKNITFIHLGRGWCGYDYYCFAPNQPEAIIGIIIFMGSLIIPGLLTRNIFIRIALSVIGMRCGLFIYEHFTLYAAHRSDQDLYIVNQYMTSLGVFGSSLFILAIGIAISTWLADAIYPQPGQKPLMNSNN